jgi:putative hemolysin
MTRNNVAPIFTLLPDSPNTLQRLMIKPLDWALGLLDLERLYRRSTCQDAGHAYFFSRILDHLEIRRRHTPEDLARIPSSGPLVVVSNHPFGALESMVLLELIQTKRPDFKVLGNPLLARIPEAVENLIAVDPYGTPASRAYNHTPMKEAFRWIRSGGVLVVFPSGEVSRYTKGGKHCVDPQWSPTLAKLILRLKAPVLPVHFRGSNSATFHLLGQLHPALRTLRLPRELLNKRRRRVAFSVGHPIPVSHLSIFRSPEEISEYLMFRTYLLEPQRPVLLSPLPPFLRPKTPPLASAIPETILEEEIARLGAGSLLAASGKFEVLVAEAHQIPGVLREIGRLREVTFRACGEGTHKPLDLDSFDHHYLHLILWDKDVRRIVGAYRMGRADRILEAKGIPGLYTSTLFKFSKPFFQEMGPALEMGRSFIRPEYQKSYQPLLLLWKSIAKFASLHPQYQRLFGVVSMSNDYRGLSKALVVKHLRGRHSHPSLARWAEPRHPFQTDPGTIAEGPPPGNVGPRYRGSVPLGLRPGTRREGCSRAHPSLLEAGREVRRFQRGPKIQPGLGRPHGGGSDADRPDTFGKIYRFERFEAVRGNRRG